jgi:hypothetical protein
MGLTARRCGLKCWGPWTTEWFLAGRETVNQTAGEWAASDLAIEHSVGIEGWEQTRRARERLCCRLSASAAGTCNLQNTRCRGGAHASGAAVRDCSRRTGGQAERNLPRLLQFGYARAEEGGAGRAKGTFQGCTTVRTNESL